MDHRAGEASACNGLVLPFNPEIFAQTLLVDFPEFFDFLFLVFPRCFLAHLLFPVNHTHLSRQHQPDLPQRACIMGPALRKFTWCSRNNEDKTMQPDPFYADIFNQAVTEIRTARTSIARQVNAAAIGVYWNLGKLLSEKKIEKGHGAGVVNRLSVDLKSEFPDMGLSPRNLWDMKRFY